LRIPVFDTEFEEAIRTGLQKGDANMVKVYKEMKQEEEAGETLSSIAIDIVPYKIKDTSLKDIVLAAPDYIVLEIEEALAERKRIALFGKGGGVDR
jgi:hypothetical protein